MRNLTQKGWGIIEILIVILMLGAGTLVMGKLGLSMVKQTSDTDAYREAVDLAVKGMEAIHGSARKLNQLSSTNELNLQGKATVFSRHTAISSVYKENNVDYKTLLVTVSWQDKQNNVHQVRLSSIAVGIHTVGNGT